MLHQLIRNARRRLLFNEVLKQFAFSAALAIGGLALLLTVGTRYLEWWVVALFAAGVIGWAVVKLRERLPGDYSAAVWLDDKAGLHDALSTAHYFATPGAKAQTLAPGAEAILLAQREQAEAAANGVNVAVAVPFRFPRALYGLAALLLVSSGLIGLRYFFGHELNLSAPITEVIFRDLAARPPAKSLGNAAKPKDYDEARSLLAKLGLGDLDEKSDEKLDQALAEALQPSNPAGADADPGQNNADPLDTPDPGPVDSKEGGDQSGSKDSQSSTGQNAKNAEPSDKSLLSKLKDAMDSMLGKSSEAGNKDKKSDSGQKSKSEEAQGGSQKGEPADNDDKRPADGESGADAQKSDAPGQVSGNKGPKAEGASAAGADDGEKAIKEAAQLKAMGKISELIGKRSEQVTGESMIDVQSGDQRLRAAYKDKSATHGEGAGEVSRDQIPLSVQEYVQEYFQQVRKPASK